jgi:hypothetical protein
MRYFTQRRKFYCGVNLHAKQMFLCILNDAGKIVLHRNLPTDGDEDLPDSARVDQDNAPENLAPTKSNTRQTVP